MINRNVYGNCWREHGSAYWCAFIDPGIGRVFPGRIWSRIESCCAWARCVVDDFGDLVIVEDWQ